MYLPVPGPPAPPPPSGLCTTFKIGCPPAPPPPNPDTLAGLYSGLQTELPAPVGMGCAGGTCHCGGKCGQHGMGIFDSGTDISGWSWKEWGVVGIGAFAVWSMMSATQSGVRSVRRVVRRRRTYKRLKEAA